MRVITILDEAMDSKGPASNTKIVDHLASLFSSPPVHKPGGTGLAKHPLDQLTIEEVAAFTGAIKAHAETLGVGPLRFNFVTAKVGFPSPSLTNF